MTFAKPIHKMRFFFISFFVVSVDYLQGKVMKGKEIEKDFLESTSLVFDKSICCKSDPSVYLPYLRHFATLLAG